MPPKCSPSSSRATWPPRDIRIRNTVTILVTATHNQARLPPWRQLVSSRCATPCSSTWARACSTGSATTAVVSCSDWLRLPTLIGTPKGSVAKFVFGAKFKNRVSEIQWLTDCQALEKATLRQNPHSCYRPVYAMGHCRRAQHYTRHGGDVSIEHRRERQRRTS